VAKSPRDGGDRTGKQYTRERRERVTLRGCEVFSEVLKVLEDGLGIVGEWFFLIFLKIKD
jgi:hypothetical protein